MNGNVVTISGTYFSFRVKQSIVSNVFFSYFRPNYVNLEKAFLPKLYKILKNGGNGSAETIYPHFLPLLPKLNRDILGEKVLTFYSNFFEHLNAGLRVQLAYKANNRSEITAIATAYYECLQYILSQIPSFPPEAFEGDLDLEQFNLNLLQAHVIDVIAYLLSGANIHNGKQVLIRIVELIQFWNQNRDNNQIYSTLLTRFWDDIYLTIENSFGLTDQDQQIRQKLELIHDLVQIFRSKSMKVQKTKPSKVKFNIDTETESNDQVDGDVKKSSEPTTFFADEIYELIVKLCKFYIKKTSDSVSDHFVRPLEYLLSEFGNMSKLFEQICGSTDITKLYDKFASWLLLSEIRSESVFNITMMLYQHLDTTEKSKLLNKLIKFPNESVKNWTLSRLLSHPLCTEPNVLRLLSQPIVTAQIIKNTQELIKGNTIDTINLLHKCFFQTENGEILIDNNTCESIIEILCNALTEKNVDENILNACVSFLSQVMPIICGDEQKGKIRDSMFVKLFALCVDKHRMSILNEETLWEAVTSWQDALSSNDIQLTDELLKTSSQIIKDSLQLIIADQNSTIEHIESISEIVSKLILCSVERFDDDNEQKYQNADKIISSVFTKLDDLCKQHLDGCLQACAFIELLNGHIPGVPLILSYLENELGTHHVYQNANALLKLATFKFRVIFKITCMVPKSRQTSENDNENEDNTGELVDVDKPLDEEHTEDFFDLNESLLKKWSDKIYDEIYGAIYLSGLFDSFLENFNVRFISFLTYIRQCNLKVFFLNRRYLQILRNLFYTTRKRFVYF